MEKEDNIPRNTQQQQQQQQHVQKMSWTVTKKTKNSIWMMTEGENGEILGILKKKGIEKWEN